jgi:hypothetical protein
MVILWAGTSVRGGGWWSRRLSLPRCLRGRSGSLVIAIQRCEHVGIRGLPAPHRACTIVVTTQRHLGARPNSQPLPAFTIPAARALRRPRPSDRPRQRRQTPVPLHRTSRHRPDPVETSAEGLGFLPGSLSHPLRASFSGGCRSGLVRWANPTTGAAGAPEALAEAAGVRGGRPARQSRHRRSDQPLPDPAPTTRRQRVPSLAGPLLSAMGSAPGRRLGARASSGG